jgi:tetratricopeptide (TPR) repeat protein
MNEQASSTVEPGAGVAMTISEAVALTRRLVDEGRIEQALETARSVARQSPGTPATALLIADVADAAGAPDAAALLQHAVMLCFALGRRRADGGEPEAALRAFRAAVALSPQTSFNHHFGGEAALRLSRLSEAAKWYTRALRLDTGDFASAQRLLDSLTALGHWRLAADAATRIAVLFPANGVVQFLSSVIERAYGRLEAAEKSMLRAAALDGWRGPYWRQYGMVLRDQGRLTEAAAALDKAAAVDPNRRDLLFGLAMCAAWIGRGPETLPHNEAALRREIDAARTATIAGDVMGACEAWAAAATMRPSDMALNAAAEREIDAGRRLLDADTRPVSERNPDWVKIQCLLAEQRYVKTMTAHPEWSGIPGLAAPSPRRPMVWDAFMFYNELDMLELRLAELSEVVDRFVLSESPWTHQGGAKPLHFHENRHRFAAWADRIVHVVADERLGRLPWDQEHYQRHCLMRGLEQAAPDDLAMVCDVDEVPRPEVVRRLAEDPLARTRLNALSITNFNYFLNYASFQPCVRPVALPVGLLRELEINQARYVTCRAGPQIVPVVPDAGWHFSWFGGVEAVWRKLQSFCHVELLGPVSTKEQLRTKLEAGDVQILKGFIDGGFVTVDDGFPVYVRRNMDRMRELGWLFQPPPKAVN